MIGRWVSSRDINEQDGSARDSNWEPNKVISECSHLLTVTFSS